MKLSEIKYHGTVEPVLRLIRSIRENGSYITPVMRWTTFWMMVWLHPLLRYQLMQWTYRFAPVFSNKISFLRSLTMALISAIGVAIGVIILNPPVAGAHNILALVVLVPSSISFLHWSIVLLIIIVVGIKNYKDLADFVSIVGMIPMIRTSANKPGNNEVVMTLLLEKLMEVSERTSREPSSAFLKKVERELYDRVFKLGVLGDDISAVYELVYRLIEERDRGLPVGSDRDAEDSLTRES
jgi:hypothetical protein